MLISNSRRFIYIHLHKCAGSSIEFALSETMAWNDVLLGSTRYGEAIAKIYGRRFPLHKHSTAAEVRAVVGDALWSGCWSFSTVRNPFALAASQYTYSMRHMRMGLRKARAAREAAGQAPGTDGTGGLKLSTREWPWSYPGVKALTSQRWSKTSFSEFIRSPHLVGWTGFTAMRPQLCDADGVLLVDDVYRVETLDGDWPSICERIGAAGLALGRENTSVRESADHRTHYADESDVRFVRERFAQDFDFFGYDDAL